jgi:hypothetical protein
MIKIVLGVDDTLEVTMGARSPTPSRIDKRSALERHKPSFGSHFGRPTISHVSTAIVLGWMRLMRVRRRKKDDRRRTSLIPRGDCNAELLQKSWIWQSHALRRL